MGQPVTFALCQVKSVNSQQAVLLKFDSFFKCLFYVSILCGVVAYMALVSVIISHVTNILGCLIFWERIELLDNKFRVHNGD